MLRNHALRSGMLANLWVGVKMEASVQANGINVHARSARAHTFRDLQRSQVFKVANPQNQRLLTNL